MTALADAVDVPHRDATATTPGSSRQLRARARPTSPDERRGERRRCSASPTCARCSADRLAGRPTRANFRTGTLTVCTLVPMRSVPHRVVCLLGLDDGVFPRHERPSTATTCWPATRGSASATAQRGPPAAARRGAGRRRAPGRHLHRRRRAHRRAAAAGRPARRAARRARPHDRGRRCTRRDIVDPAPAAALRPAQLHRRLGAPPVQLRPGALGRRAPAAVQRPRAGAVPRRPLPVRWPGRRRARGPASPSSSTRSGRSCGSGCGSTLPARTTRSPTRCPSTLDGLRGVGGRRAAARTSGCAGRTRRRRLRGRALRGTLPPGPLGARCCSEVGGRVDALVAASAALRAGSRRTVDVDVDLGDGRALTGTVAGVRDDAAGRVTYSRLGRQAPAARLGLAARALRRRPDQPGRAVTVGRARRPGAHVDRHRAGRPVRRAGRPRRPVRPRHARAAADGGEDVGAYAGDRLDGRPPSGRSSRAPKEWETDRPAASARTPSPTSYVWGANAGARAAVAAEPGDGRACAGETTGSARWPAGSGAGSARAEQVSMNAVRLCGPLPTGTTVLEASAGTGKTFTIAALVARYVAEGVADAGRDAGRHLRPRVDPRAARAGARAAGRGRARRCADPAGARGRRRPRRSQLLADADDGGRAPAPAARAGARRLRRGDDRHHPRVLPAGAAPRSASPATPTPARRSSRTSTTWCARWSTTSTCASSAHARDRPAADPRRELLELGRRGGRQRPASRAAGRRRRPTAAPAGAGRGRRRGARARWSARKRRPALVDYDDMLIRAARRADRRARGRRRVRAAARRGTGWCWSTSSRTPTRCSGRSCGGPSTATAPWC